MTQDLDALPLPKFTDDDADQMLRDMPWCKWSDARELVKACFWKGYELAKREAQEGREPVAWLTREQIDSIMTQHYPLDSLLRENVDAFEACVRDIEKALFSSPPPKSDEARDAERLLIAAQAVVDWHGELGHDSLAMAELRAALAAQQSKGEA